MWWLCHKKEKHCAKNFVISKATVPCSCTFCQHSKFIQIVKLEKILFKHLHTYTYIYIIGDLLRPLKLKYDKYNVIFEGILIMTFPLAACSSQNLADWFTKAASRLRLFSFFPAQRFGLVQRFHLSILCHSLKGAQWQSFFVQMTTLSLL